ncbi:MAG: CopG family transcriptional regulator [Chloroflexi bacterium RBG_16_57_8]|nr:MAG: CopG family transcriptional regulator [Chloroflexi bacterium RBG_16_57_8]
MASVKTAISIEKPLFEELESLAEEMDVSRSHLISLAAKEFIDRHKSRKLLEAINAAYDDVPDPEEEKRRALMRAKQRRMVEGQW